MYVAQRFRLICFLISSNTDSLVNQSKEETGSVHVDLTPEKEEEDDGRGGKGGGVVFWVRQ